MKHELIKTENYLLVVDDSEIAEHDWYYDSKTIYVPVKQSFENSHEIFDGKKIIAHLPLNNSPILEGVDLLPELLVLSTYPSTQELNQWLFNKEPKLPIAINVELEPVLYPEEMSVGRIMTTANSQSQRVWVGKYIY
jgi:hypothetical protein